MSEAPFILYLADILILSNMFKNRTNLQFYRILKNQYSETNFNLCNNFNYHPKLQPGILCNSPKHISLQQERGLLIRRHRLLFVSCHLEQTHWIHQLKELVVVFDIYTWLLLLFFLFIVSCISNHLSKSSTQNVPKFDPYICLNTCFSLFATMIEQSSNLYDYSKLKNKYAFFLTFSAIPLAMSILVNQYKGDNITNLTLEPPLVPFDKFEILVEYKFKIFSRPIRLVLYSEFTKYMLGVENDYIQGNRHEAFPIVSQLWFEKMGAVGTLKKLSSLTNELSERSWWYLNHSEIHPKWNSTSVTSLYEENTYNLMESHVEECQKSAAILSEEDSIPMYNSLKVKQKPVYLGKEIINEYLNGYVFVGYLPTQMMSRAKHFFETGIVNWWQGHFRWSLMMKTKAKEVQLLSGKNSNMTVNFKARNENQVYGICLIPLIGLCLSICLFIIFESKISKFFGDWLCKVFLTVKLKMLLVCENMNVLVISSEDPNTRNEVWAWKTKFTH